MAESRAGWAEEIGGKWHIRAGAYEAPEMTIIESELLAPSELSLNRSLKDTINSVNPVMRSENSGYNPVTLESVQYDVRFTVTADAGTDTFTATAHGRSNGDRIRISSTGSTPTGLDEGEYYYLIGATTNTFQLSESEGGAAVNITTAGTGTLTANYDPYLTIDEERIYRDLQFSHVNDDTQAKRLALITLKQIRNEAIATLHCKIGTADACPFDLVTGDSVRWIDSIRQFWEYTASAVAGVGNASDAIDSAAHGLTAGDPIVFTYTSDTRYAILRPFYVVNAATDTFQIAEYRGGPALPIDDGGDYIYRTIQGKLFRVAMYKFVHEDMTPSVDLTLISTTPEVYEWDSTAETAPTTSSGITQENPFFVHPPVGINLESGTNVLYIRQDGTVGTRIRVTWSPSISNLVKSGGKTEVEFKANNTLDVTSISTINGEISTAPVNHGYVGGERVRLRSSTGDVPDGFTDGGIYDVIYVSADTIKLAYHGETSAIIPTDVGSGDITLFPEFGWSSAGTISGASNELFISDVEDGIEYDVRVRHRNAMGASSDWVNYEGHTVIGKTEAPNQVTGIETTGASETSFSVKFTPPSDKDFNGVVIYRAEPDEYEVTLIDSSTDTLTCNGHGLSNGDIIYFSLASSTQPSGDFESGSGISLNSPYYVINAATNTFQISLTSGGSAVDIGILSYAGVWVVAQKFSNASEYFRIARGVNYDVHTTDTPQERYYLFLRSLDTTGNLGSVQSLGIVSTTLVTNFFGSPAATTVNLQTKFSAVEEGFYEDYWDSSNSSGYMVSWGLNSNNVYGHFRFSIPTEPSGNVVYAFKRSATAPTVPVADASNPPSGWSSTPPSGTDRLWFIKGDLPSGTPWATSILREVVTPIGRIPQTI